MEIEAKFVVPNARIAGQLRQLRQLGDFTLGAATEIQVQDTFYDTPARDLSAARVVLRVRSQSDGKMLLTVKHPTSLRGAVHRRPEREITMPWEETPRALSRDALPKPIRALLAPSASDQKLVPLFSIRQARSVRPVRRGSRIVAEWSLDRVHFRSGTRRRAFYELEIELQRTGRTQDLKRIVALLEQARGLEPMTRSKFERALAFAVESALR